MRARNILSCIAGPVSVALLGFAIGCYPDPTTNPNVSDDAAAPAPAFINVVHAAPDVALVDLYIDKQKTSPTLDFRKATGNQQITPTAHILEVRPTGAAPTSMPLLTSNFTLLPGSQTLLVVVGKQHTADPAAQLRLVAAPYGTPDSQSVKVRLLNAVPGSPTLDLAAGNNALAIGADFGAASSYGSSPSLPAATKLGLRTSHTTSDLAYVTFPPMGNPGSVVTVIAMGDINPLTSDDAHFFGATVLDEKLGDVFDVPRVINDAGPMGSVFLVNASPDAPAIDVANAQNMKLIQNLAYQQASVPVSFTASAAAISVLMAGSNNVLFTATLRLLPGLNWTLVAEGSTAKNSLKLVALPRPATAATAWRLVHAVSDGDTFTATVGTQTVVPSLAYGQATPLIDGAVPAPMLTLIANAGQGTKYNVAIPQAVLDAGQGQLTTVIATGTVTAPSKLAMLAILDNTAMPMMAPTVFQLASVAMLAPQAKRSAAK